MSKEKKKNVFAMVVLMALPVVLGAMFILSKEFKEENFVSDQSLIIPDVDDIKSVDDDKAKIYRDEQIELMYRKNQDARNVASDKDFFAIDSDSWKDENMKDDASLDRETQQVLEEYRKSEKEKTFVYANTDEQVDQSKNLNQSSTRQSKTSEVSASKNELVIQPSGIETAIVVRDDSSRRKSSMGIYTANLSSENPPAEAKIDLSKKYLRAVLEEDKIIQNGSNVIFVLSDDGIISGTNHKRGSILYGRATQGREFFEINIYQVKSANDGNMYTADLIVYDENYNRGIRSEGFLNEVSKEEGANAAAQTVDEATQGATSLRALDIATRAITRTATRTVRSKPITIPLRKGYKVYLQSKPNEK